jgi:hypothetical protein
MEVEHAGDGVVNARFGYAGLSVDARAFLGRPNGE